MDGLLASAAARMPLADGALHIWRWAIEPAYLDELYERHRQRGYSRVLEFSTLVHLIADALLVHGGSGREAFETAREQCVLPASVQAAYGKLRRFPPELSEVFLAQTTARLRQLWPAGVSLASLPKSLDRYDPLVLDGKTVKGIARRLKPLRNVSGGVVGGKALVALDLRHGLAIAMRTRLDGNANEVLLTPELTADVRTSGDRPRLWIGDRAFSYVQQTLELGAESDAFLVRRRADIVFEPDTDVPARSGSDEEGRRWREQYGWLSRHRQPRAVRVRQISLPLDEGDELILVTSLLDSRAIPAADLLALYRQRWSIERVFQDVTEVFGLRHLIGSTPQASLFQFALCLVLYNTLQLIRAYIAAGQQRPAADLSTEKIFRDLQRQLGAWMLLFSPAAAIARHRAIPTQNATREYLATHIGRCWTPRWLKAPPQKRRAPPKSDGHGKHVSAQVIIEKSRTRRKKRR